MVNHFLKDFEMVIGVRRAEHGDHRLAGAARKTVKVVARESAQGAVTGAVGLRTYAVMAKRRRWR
jgi:hypothetical protein